MAKSQEERLKSRQERLEHKRRTMENGWEIPLPTTSIVLGEETKARVRRIDLYNEARINQMPAEFQEAVSEGLKFLDEAQQKARDEGLTDDTVIDRVRNNRRLLPSAHAFAKATFLDPLLFDTDEEMELWQKRNPNSDIRAWVISLDDDLTDLEAADCMEWFFACLNADSVFAKRMKPFRPKSVIDVEYRATGETDRGTTPSDPEDARTDERRPVEVLPIG